MEKIVLTKEDKLKLIDEYLTDTHIDPRWRVMVAEYRRMLTEKDGGAE